MKNVNDIIEIIKTSKNKHEVLQKIKWDTRTTGYRQLNKFIIDNDIDISHFETRKDQYQRTKHILLSGVIYPLEDILVSGSTYQNTSGLKKRLYKENIKKPICEKCGQDEWWHGEKISLILDHINGIHNDNRIENLRIVCPNCEYTLPTHCRNINKEKVNKKLSPNIKKLRKKDQSIKARKIERPSIEQLQYDISLLGFVKTGKKYGVSDNAIRKWVRFYEKY